MAASAPLGATARFSAFGPIFLATRCDGRFSGLMIAIGRLASLTRTLTILAGPALFLFGTCLFDRSAPLGPGGGALAVLAVTPAVYRLPVWMIMLAVEWSSC
jgi:hypothetical protein